MRRGLRIETFVGAGHYQHKVYDVGVSARNRQDGVSEEAVEALKKVNERLWEEMPRGSGPVVSEISYRPPVQSAPRRILEGFLRYISGR
jgi:hypothetical protein